MVWTSLSLFRRKLRFTAQYTVQLQLCLCLGYSPRGSPNYSLATCLAVPVKTKLPGIQTDFP